MAITLMSAEYDFFYSLSEGTSFNGFSQDLKSSQYKILDVPPGGQFVHLNKTFFFFSL